MITAGRIYSLLLGQVTRGAEHDNDGVVLELDGARRTIHVSSLLV